MSDPIPTLAEMRSAFGAIGADIATVFAQVRVATRRAARIIRRAWKPYRGHHSPVPTFRPNAPRRRMRTPGGRIVRRVMR